MRVRHIFHKGEGEAVREEKGDGLDRVVVIWDRPTMFGWSNLPLARNLVFRVPCGSRPMQ